MVLELGNQSLLWLSPSILTCAAFSDSIAQALVSTLAFFLPSPVPRAL